MNIIKTSAAVLAALVATASVNAQDQSGVTEAPSSGLISKRYISAGFGYIDVRHSNVDAYAAGVDFNMPLNSLVDLHASFTHSYVENHSDLDGQGLSIGATSYLVQGSVKPYFRAEVGYVWSDGDGIGFDYTLSAGGEYELTEKLSLNAYASFNDGFEDDTETSDEWSGTLQANYWATKSLVTSLGTTWFEGGHVGVFGSVAYKF